MSNWFYLDENNDQVGPHSAAELVALANAGIVKASTPVTAEGLMVTAEGLTEWQTWDQLRETILAQAGLLEPGVSPAPGLPPPLLAEHVTPGSSTKPSGKTRLAVCLTAVLALAAVAVALRARFTRTQPGQTHAGNAAGAAQTQAGVPSSPGRAERRGSAHPWKLIWVREIPLERVSCLRYDEPRNCVWFSQNGILCKYDLKTETVKLVTDGRDKGGIGALCITLEGQRLWIGGHGITSGAGGLWMYDVPTDSAIVYRVENTMDGSRKGLPNNAVGNILVDDGYLWIYSHNGVFSDGLTRFAPKETEHARRWRTWTVNNTASNPSKRDGLFSNCLTGVVPVKDGGYWLFFDEGCAYQHFDPQSSSFRTSYLMPPNASGNPSEEAKVAAGDIRGARFKIWQSPGPFKFIAWRDDEIWYHGYIWSDGRPEFSVGGAAALCFNTKERSCTVFSRSTTESYPGANDGMFDGSGLCAFDGKEIWMGHSGLANVGITRYNRDRNEFTHYTDRATDIQIAGGMSIDLLGGEFTAFHRINQISSIAVTSDYVFFGTSAGLLIYQKSDLWPAMTASSPAQGARDVAPEKELTVTFDRPLNRRTVNGRSVELWVNGALFGGNVKYDERHRSVVFSIPSRLPGGMDGDLVCKSLIQADNGNPIPWTRIKFRTR